MAGTVQAYIGLGTNVGPGRATLEHAVVTLSALPGVMPSGVSRLYRTRPVGPVAQADFWNAVVGLRVPAGDAAADAADAALDLLVELKRIERENGRRESERWGPRELDLDLLLFGDEAIHAARPVVAHRDDVAATARQWLDVPHPEASRRLFVLAPLAELAPELRPPGWDVTVAQARDRALVAEGAAAVRVVGAWHATAQRWLDTA
jgi:2-amino-4-hydroxy-6-hydroxymethyldihydropteridine diphosphokinase